MTSSTGAFIEHPINISRRTFLSGTLSLSAVPLLVRSGASFDCDVVIVGGGAAGLAAGETLHKSGKTVIVLEATGRLGGRAFTDKQIFGTPFDLGAHWLYYDECNFFKQFALRNPDLQIYESPGSDYIIYLDQRVISENQTKVFIRGIKNAYTAISDSGASGLDQSVAVALNTIRSELGTWEPSVRFVLGPWEMAKELEHVSAMDLSKTEDVANQGCSKEWLCREGYGTLLSRYAQKTVQTLPEGSVRLQTPVKGIELTGRGVAVESLRGTISCKACIVTVSTGALANDIIRFRPALPASKRRSFEQISMGLYNRVGLKFDRDVLGLGEDRFLFRKIISEADLKKGVGFTTNVGGSNLIYCDFGAGHAREVEEMGQRGAVDYALARFSETVGSSVRSRFSQGFASFWGRHRFTFGSYASAEPGGHRFREVLREPLEDRIFFAGEACHRSQWATVGGAYESGRQVALQVASRLSSRRSQPCMAGEGC